MADGEGSHSIRADVSKVVENTESKHLVQERPPSTLKLRRMDSFCRKAGNVSSTRSHVAKVRNFLSSNQWESAIISSLAGRAFALYSLISRHAKVSLLPNQQVEDAMLTNYNLETPSTQTKRAQWIKEKLESSTVAKIMLILLTILETSMIMGDGILTPCVSVLSAVSGIKQKAEFLTEGEIAIITIVILIMLFYIQRFGIDKVGYTFSPILLMWCGLISGIGIYNLLKYDARVLRAFNPKYIVDYFRRNGKQGWISLGGVVLCTTGSEAMFADLGHFNVRAIQISFTTCVFPSVLLSYIGQAAYLTKFLENVADAFYKSIPSRLFWPTFIIAVAAAVIASQAVISCVFSIIAQAQTLGCFPRVKVVHTSAKYEGQVYIPELNFALMTACILELDFYTQNLLKESHQSSPTSSRRYLPYILS